MLELEPVRQQIKQRVADSEFPSMAVAVAKDGKIIWEEAFGWADKEKMIPATVDTLYSLASVSKPMTATGIMVLMERGQLDLDAPVNDYLASDSQMHVWIGDPKDVTIRRIAIHTAGLPRHGHFFNHNELNLMPPMEESIRRYGNIVIPPGERYCYSNFGYGILDHVIARTSGMSFTDFMRQDVFLPLGMTHSSVDIAPDLAEFVAVRYDEGNQPVPFYSCDHAGASSIWSSVHDLVRFGMSHIGQLRPDQKAILSSDARTAMMVPTASMSAGNPEAANLSSDMYYGLGWVLMGDAFGGRINHVGGMNGAKAQLVILPEQGIVVAVVTNKFCLAPERTSEAVLATMIPDYTAKMSEYRRTMKNSPQPANRTEAKVIPMPMGDWEGLVHTYAADFPFSLSFKESGEVTAQLGPQSQTPVNDLWFVDGRLMGSMEGKIETPDALMRRQSPLKLDLKVRGNVINGVLVATISNALSYWVELHKK